MNLILPSSLKNLIPHDNDLTIPNANAMTQYSDEAFAAIAAGADYLPRIQLMTGNSELVQEGKMNVGRYAFIRTKEDVVDLGKEVDVLVCAWRLKAMRVKDENIISVFDINDPEFMKIKNDSGIKDSGALCGAEFLIWVPSQKSFATFYMASKSAKREAPAMRAHIDTANNKPGPATLKSTLVDNGTYKWHAPIVNDCSTPFDLPTQDDFVENVNKFLNPPKNTVETAEPAGNAGRER